MCGIVVIATADRRRQFYSLALLCGRLNCSNRNICHPIFLCTVYVPECQRLESPTAMLSSSPVTALGSQNSSDAEFSQVVLPERGMCQAVRKACPLLFSGHGIGGRSLLGGVVPKFLQCDIYAPVCRQNKLRPKIFDANKATCQAPLVSTTNSRNWQSEFLSIRIKGIATCAFPCRSPVYRPEHYILARSLTFGAAIAGILVNISVLSSEYRGHERSQQRGHHFSHSPYEKANNSTPINYLHPQAKHRCTLRLLRSPTSTSNSTPCTAPINQKSITGAPEEDLGTLPVVITTLGTEPKRRLPHTALTFIHLSFLVGCFGLLMPHLPGVGDSIACRADGSVRVGEPQTQ
ncbi:hypothetical protein ACTXT7_004403 [Hymenolepis weldensis]